MAPKLNPGAIQLDFYRVEAFLAKLVVIRSLEKGAISKSLTLIKATIVSITAVLAVGGFIPGLWLCDLLSQFRMPIAVVILVCLLSLAVIRARVAAILCLVSLVVNCVPIVSMLMPRFCNVADQPTFVSLLNFNTEFQHNNNYKLFEQLVSERRPDVIALVEIDKKWIDAIGETSKYYPYKKIVLECPGMALFSKYPIEQSEVRYFGKSHHPRIFAVLKVGEQRLHIVLVHPTTPKSDAGFQERNIEMALVRDEITAFTGPKMIAGDLNCGPWSPAFARMLETGLHDSEQGFGPQPSWPARTGRVIENFPVPPLVPIDHVLVSGEICVLERRAGPGIESDHLPVFVRLAIAKASQ